MTDNNASHKSIMSIYKQAVKNLPLLRYSWVMIATICILALVAYFKLNNSDVFFYAFGVIAISFFTFLFSFFCSKTKDRFIRVLLYIMLSAIVLTTGVTILGFGSYIIWQKPVFFTKWFPEHNSKINTVPPKTTTDTTSKLTQQPVVQQNHWGNGDNVTGNKVIINK